MGKHRIEISDDLYSDILEYCKLNGLKIGSFINDLLTKQFAIEQYGDTPFANYEVSTNPHTLTTNITVETKEKNVVPSEVTEAVVKDDKIYGETEQPSVVFAPYTIQENSPLVTNIDGDISEKYSDKKVPSEYYGTITMEKVEKALEEIYKHTSKPKKHRL
jgi:hypothetical protein